LEQMVSNNFHQDEDLDKIEVLDLIRFLKEHGVILPTLHVKKMIIVSSASAKQMSVSAMNQIAKFNIKILTTSEIEKLLKGGNLFSF